MLSKHKNYLRKNVFDFVPFYRLTISSQVHYRLQGLVTKFGTRRNLPLNLIRIWNFYEILKYELSCVLQWQFLNHWTYSLKLFFSTTIITMIQIWSEFFYLNKLEKYISNLGETICKRFNFPGRKFCNFINCKYLSCLEIQSSLLFFKKASSHSLKFYQ